MRRLTAIAAALLFPAAGAVAQGYDPRHPYVFYEGNSCTQDRLFSAEAGFRSYSCGGFPAPCFGNNDEARSVLIKFNNLNFSGGVKFHLTVYDSPLRSGDKDSATITLYGKPAGRTTYCVSSFDKTRSLGFLDLRRKRGRTDDGKLDGKISYIDTSYSW